MAQENFCWCQRQPESAITGREVLSPFVKGQRNEAGVANHDAADIGCQSRSAGVHRRQGVDQQMELVLPGIKIDATSTAREIKVSERE